MWSDFHAQSIRALFDNLDQSEISWLVIGNYTGLPDKNEAKDVDLIIPKYLIGQAIGIIIKTMKDHGFNYFTHTRFECIWCFTFYSAQKSVPLSIKIDLLYGFVWRGAVVVDASEMLLNSTTYNGFRVPILPMDGFLLWIKPLMTGGFIKEKYRGGILKAIASHPQAFQALLVSKFGNSLTGKIWPLLKAGRLEETVVFQETLCQIAWTTAFKSQPVKTIKATTEHFLREIHRRSKRQKGTMLAVVGPDGVGKSTFIELFEKGLSRIFIKDNDAILVAHFRPNLLPNIKKLLSGKKYDPSTEEFTNPHRAKQAGVASSFIRLTYYWLDYVFGYWLGIRRKCIRGNVVIFDRYFYDFIVDPRRSRIRLPVWIRKVFLALTPQPDLVFFLDCDAEIVYSRKQELSHEEIERQLDAYHNLAKAHPQRFVILDALQVPEVMCLQAIKHIIERSFRPL
jgi:thymidylate kinase